MAVLLHSRRCSRRRLNSNQSQQAVTDEWTILVAVCKHKSKHEFRLRKLTYFSSFWVVVIRQKLQEAGEFANQLVGALRQWSSAWFVLGLLRWKSKLWLLLSLTCAHLFMGPSAAARWGRQRWQLDELLRLVAQFTQWPVMNRWPTVFSLNVWCIFLCLFFFVFFLGLATLLAWINIVILVLHMVKGK